MCLPLCSFEFCASSLSTSIQLLCAIAQLYNVFQAMSQVTSCFFLSFFLSEYIPQFRAGVLAQRAQGVHSAHIMGRKWGFLLQLAIFLPIQTILNPHNVGQSWHLMCTLLVKYVLVTELGLPCRGFTPPFYRAGFTLSRFYTTF